MMGSRETTKRERVMFIIFLTVMAFFINYMKYIYGISMIQDIPKSEQMKSGIFE